MILGKSHKVLDVLIDYYCPYRDNGIKIFFPQENTIIGRILEYRFQGKDAKHITARLFIQQKVIVGICFLLFQGFYAFSYPVSGGKGNTVTIVSPSKSFADMAPKEPKFMDIMTKAMGEDKAEEFMTKWGGTFKAGQNQLLKYRSKLSDYGDKK